MSDYARLIQSEKFYKEKIRQLTEENQKLRELIEPIILDEYDNGDYNNPDIINGELVEDE